MIIQLRASATLPRMADAHFFTMRSYIRQFLLAFCLIACTQNSSILSAGGAGGNTSCAAATTAHASSQERGRSRCLLCDDHHGGEALITDSSQLLRICGERSSRLVNGGGNVKRSMQRHCVSVKNIILITGHHRSGHSRPTRAIMPMPQSDYYVFVLRRLLC